MRALGIIGASSHGKVVADIAARMGYTEIYFYDDDASVKTCGVYPVFRESRKALATETDLFVAVGNARIRQELQTMLEAAGKSLPILIHPSSVIAADASIGLGSVVMAGTVINPDCIIGKGCIVNTSASVGPDCRLGDFVHVSVGAHLAGTVMVGDRTWIGVGATVSNSIQITGDCMLGAGAVVVKNIAKSGIYIGAPAKEKEMDMGKKKTIRGGKALTHRGESARPVWRAAA